MVFEFAAGGNHEQLTQKLNALGIEGWELVSAGIQSSNTSYSNFYLKRKL